MKKLLLATAAVLCLATPALSAGNDQMGVGLSPCGEFSTLIRKKDHGAVNEMIFYSWAQGFISAANYSRLMQGADSVNVSATSNEDQRQQLREYCNAHPLKEFIDAVASLINNMPTNVGSAAAAAEQAKAMEK